MSREREMVRRRPASNARRSTGLKMHGANMLTGGRVVLTPVFAGAVALAAHMPACGRLAAAVFAIVALSDVLDGRLARRWGTANADGRTFDHLADITFILAALVTYARVSIVPWWVPAAVAGSFGFYVFDSWAHTSVGSRNLLGSRVGHAAGVLNYALIGVVVFNNTVGIGLLSPALLRKLCWLVPLYSVAAVVTRLAGRRAASQRPNVVVVRTTS
jgi:phosphatidylglycerophosphate synthase